MHIIHDPTPDEILAACEAIQARWDDHERHVRAGAYAPQPAPFLALRHQDGEFLLIEAMVGIAGQRRRRCGAGRLGRGRGRRQLTGPPTGESRTAD
jgi:hypothetical protein